MTTPKSHPATPRVTRFGTPARPPADRVKETDAQRDLRQTISAGNHANRRRKPSLPPLPAHWKDDDE